METIAKKPIFSFLEVEIVKSLKKIAMNPPEFLQSSKGEGVGKEKVLDNLML